MYERLAAIAAMCCTALALLLIPVVAEADVIPPSVDACRGKSDGDSCSWGVCREMTCSRYNGRTGTTRTYNCTKCVAEEESDEKKPSPKKTDDSKSADGAKPQEPSKTTMEEAFMGLSSTTPEQHDADAGGKPGADAGAGAAAAPDAGADSEHVPLFEEEGDEAKEKSSKEKSSNKSRPSGKALPIAAASIGFGLILAFLARARSKPDER